MIPSSLLATPWRRWAAAMLFVASWYWVMRVIGLWLFGVAPKLSAVPWDLGANLLLGTLLFAITRTPVWFGVATATLMAALQLSNAGKIAVLGGPIMPDDFQAVTNLFLLLDGWQLIGAAAILAIPLSLSVVAISWRSLRTWSLLAGLALAGALFVAFPTPIVKAMDASFGNIVWNQRGNFEGRGLLIHLAQEGARYLHRASTSPSRVEVEEALAVVQPGQAFPAAFIGGSQQQRRNVHMILLESFWDPSVLTAARLSQDPLDPEFRKLWALTGHSRALSPVFGGYTANAEFEVLCGFPVTEDRVFFEGSLRRKVPCLPQYLGAEGYRSIASHPNSAAFWNRVNAYDRIGFDNYWVDKDFVLDDMNGPFLSDASFYRQVLEKVEPLLDSGTPMLDYILTYFGHLEYPLNERRPTQVDTAGDSSLVRGYVNTIYYKSRELMAFLKVLREKDPDGLIVLFGDHLPFLGPNFAGFTDSGLLRDNRSKLTDDMLLTLVATPLVVIDGRRGPLRLGDVPMYQLPALILDLLGDQRPSIMQLTSGPGDAPVRPLPGMYFVARDGEVDFACRADGDSQDDGCNDFDRWMAAVITLTRDIFAGHQFALRAVPASPQRQESGPSTAGSAQTSPAG